MGIVVYSIGSKGDGTTTEGTTTISVKDDGISLAKLAAETQIWVKLTDTTLTSDSATVDITSIPTTYKVLKILVLLKGSASIALRPIFNDDSGANQYTSIGIQGNGAAVSAWSSTATYATCGYMENTTYTVFEVIIQNSADAVIRTGQSFCCQGGSSVEYIIGFKWLGTSQITKITFTNAGGNIKAGSRIILYGWA